MRLVLCPEYDTLSFRVIVLPNVWVLIESVLILRAVGSFVVELENVL